VNLKSITLDIMDNKITIVTEQLNKNIEAELLLSKLPLNNNRNLWRE